MTHAPTPTPASDLEGIPDLRRVENYSKASMTALAFEMTKESYSHEQIYGQYCTLEEYVDCPPERAYEYLADVYNLAEWTYSLRDFGEPDGSGVVESTDKIGSQTKIYTRVEANRTAMTVDYHCAWDQGADLWMIYLMRVVPAGPVLKMPGSVILWTNCRHPYYDDNPHPELAPADRSVWVGDMWPYFYAGHRVEMENLKRILEYRFGSGRGSEAPHAVAQRSPEHGFDEDRLPTAVGSVGAKLMMPVSTGPFAAPRAHGWASLSAQAGDA